MGPTLRRLLPDLWAVALAVLLLGPALGVGYLLTYDMVWVPDLAVRGDFLGLGPALPRAVPSDLVVALADEVVPGMLLQKAVLLGCLAAGGIGAARLAGPGLVARSVAVSVAVWSPFVVERLWIGHWPVVLCWAALPWLVLAGARFRDESRVGAALPLLLLVGSLSANAGVMSAAVLLAVAATRRRRPLATLLVLVGAANAPWVVAGLLHASSATSDSTGSVFALNGDGLPAPLAALTLGGIWNAQVVPGSRDVLALGVVATGLLVAAAAYGLRPAWRRLGARTCGALAGLWVAGYLLAVLTWLAPDATGWLAAHVPGGGLLRDGARWLALCVPLVVVLVAAGCERLVRRLRTPGLRPVVAAGAVLAPLALLPGAAWGLLGTMAPADYPDDYAATRAALSERPDGDLLVLPFSGFRAPAWNHGRTVLDPLPRYLQPDYVVNDELAVDSLVLAGEDPRTPQVYAALALPTEVERSAALTRLGIAMVAREHGVPALPTQDAPLAGVVLHDGPEVEVVRLPGSVDVRAPATGWVVALTVAWSAYAGLPVVAGWNTFRLRRSGIRSPARGR